MTDTDHGLCFDSIISSTAYEIVPDDEAKSKAAILNKLPDPSMEVLFISSENGPESQPHFVAVDAVNRRLLVVVRGTYRCGDKRWDSKSTNVINILTTCDRRTCSVMDAMTDFMGVGRVIDVGVCAHEQMSLSAQNLLRSVTPVVLPFLEKKTDFVLTFIGHSLGELLWILGSEARNITQHANSYTANSFRRWGCNTRLLHGQERTV